MGYLFGIDIGGTTVKIGFFEGDKLVDKFEIPTDTSNNGSNIMKDITDAIKKHVEERNLSLSNVKGYGFGIPGPVVKNFTETCVNLGLKNYDIKEEFNKYIKCNNVVAANDANVAAAGEYWLLKDKGVNSAVFLTFGTGVGGGIILDGKLLEGENGAAAETGHMVVKYENARKCACGNEGCLETIASASRVALTAKEFVDASDEDTTLRDLQDITAKDVFDAAKEGDKLAIEIVEEVGKYIGIALSHIAATVDPEVFIFGGGMSKAGEILTEVSRKYYLKYAMTPLKNVKFNLASLGNDAGMYGAAYLLKR